MPDDEPNLYLQVLIVCEEHGFVTAYGKELIELLVDSIVPDDE